MGSQGRPDDREKEAPVPLETPSPRVIVLPTYEMPRTRPSPDREREAAQRRGLLFRAREIDAMPAADRTEALQRELDGLCRELNAREYLDHLDD